VKIIISIGTLELLENDIFIFLGCNLSAILPRSTFTKYHLLDSQYPCEIKPVDTPKSDDVNCSAKFTGSLIRIFGIPLVKILMG